MKERLCDGCRIWDRVVAEDYEYDGVEGYWIGSEVLAGMGPGGDRGSGLPIWWPVGKGMRVAGLDEVVTSGETG